MTVAECRYLCTVEEQGRADTDRTGSPTGVDARAETVVDDLRIVQPLPATQVACTDTSPVRFCHSRSSSGASSTPHNAQIVHADEPYEAGQSIRLPPEDEWDPPDDIEFPPESSSWTNFERDLFFMSEGLYHPGEMVERRRVDPNMSISGTGVSLEVQGRVSIVSPTMSSRQRFHEQLWASFEAQTWPDKELIVVETYETTPSAFLQKKAAEDSRLVYVCIQRDEDDDFSVGLKRDMTLHLASGEYIVNFDDDDIYAAAYTTRMVGEMQEKGLSAITLSAWHNYLWRRVGVRGFCTYSDHECWDAKNQTELDEVLYGYGFSYVHQRAIALLFPYPNLVFAEDAPFLLKLREVLGDSKVALKKDVEGICMHIMHRANSTGDPKFSKQLTQAELAGLEVATLPLFRPFLEAQSLSWWMPIPRWRVTDVLPLPAELPALLWRAFPTGSECKTLSSLESEAKADMSSRQSLANVSHEVLLGMSSWFFGNASTLTEARATKTDATVEAEEIHQSV